MICQPFWEACKSLARGLSGKCGSENETASGDVVQESRTPPWSLELAIYQGGGSSLCEVTCQMPWGQQAARAQHHDLARSSLHCLCYYRRTSHLEHAWIAFRRRHTTSTPHCRGSSQRLAQHHSLTGVAPGTVFRGSAILTPYPPSVTLDIPRGAWASICLPEFTLSLCYTG